MIMFEIRGQTVNGPDGLLANGNFTAGGVPCVGDEILISGMSALSLKVIRRQWRYGENSINCIPFVTLWVVP